MVSAESAKRRGERVNSARAALRSIACCEAGFCRFREEDEIRMCEIVRQAVCSQKAPDLRLQTQVIDTCRVTAVVLIDRPRVWCAGRSRWKRVCIGQRRTGMNHVFDVTCTVGVLGSGGKYVRGLSAIGRDITHVAIDDAHIRGGEAVPRGRPVDRSHSHFAHRARRSHHRPPMVEQRRRAIERSRTSRAGPGSAARALTKGMSD